MSIKVTPPDNIRLAKKPAIQKRLLEAMQQRNVSITNLAYALDLSKASVSEWLRGGGLSMQNLAAIALELNVSIDWLLMGKGTMDLFGSIHPTEEEMELVYHLRQTGPSTFDTFFRMISNIAKPIMGEDPVNQILTLDMLEQSRMALCVISHDGHIVDLNDAFLQVLGDNLDKTTDVIGTHFAEWITEEDIANAVIMMQTSYTRGYSTNFSCRIMRKQSSPTANTKPFMDIIVTSLYNGTEEKGYYQCIVFPLDT